MLLASPVGVASKCQEVIPTLWQWHPPIGVIIALLAVVGVLVPWFRGEAGKSEKAFWTFLMFLCVGLEIRTIYLDQAQHDREQTLARCQQLESFQKIADGIDTATSNSSAQFVATMTNMGKILTKQDATLTQTMGGTTYPEFIATFPTDPASKEMAVWVITPGQSWPHGHIPTPEETAPLPDVTVDVAERPVKVEEMTTSELESLMHPMHYNLGTLMVPGMFTAPFKLQKGKRYTLQITTRRGEFREDIYIDRDASAVGGWKESSCVYGRRTIYKRGVVTRVSVRSRPC
jgi:hypothetical protein